MPKRAPYFHVYMGLMVVFASYAMGMTMRVREARLHWNTPHGCSRKVAPPAPVVSEAWKPVVEKYAGGVCLLTGKISYLDEAGKPFRYDVAAYEQRGELVPDPNGPVFVYNFAGTAFHIGNGVVLTNEDIFMTKGIPVSLTSGPNDFIPDREISIGKHKVTESFSNVRAYFPNRPEPFQLKADGFRFVHNVPEFTFELNGADVTALQVYDFNDYCKSYIGHNEKVGRKLLLLWQPTWQETDPSRLATPTVAETSIGWNSGSTFLMNNFRDGQISPPGAPILDEKGVVIGITGTEAVSFGLVESEFDTSGIMPRMPVVMGETYGAHLCNLRASLSCDCESGKSSVSAKKSPSAKRK